jgi:transcriptional regulator GlxA family with amidase domain
VLEADKTERTIAFVLYPGLTILDLAGPLEVFGSFVDSAASAGLPETYEIALVAEYLETMPTDTPLGINANKTFAEVPHPFAVFVPGGSRPTVRALMDDTLLDYLRSTARTAEIVGSICTGAILLAGAGLLDGRRATTHWSFHGVLDRMGALYVPERWVEDGKFITAAGVSAGIDMALHVVGRLGGEAVEGEVQLIIEYDPQPPLGPIDWGSVDRDALASWVDGVLRESLAGRPDLLSRLTG